MNETISYWRIATIVLAAGTIWLLSTFVPSPYKKDTALVPMDAARQVSRPEPISNARMPAASPSLATID